MDHDTVIMLTNMQRDIEALLARVEALENPPRKDKLPFLEHFPPLDKIVRVKAQLFKNAPKQGNAIYRVKVALWDRPAAREHGEYTQWLNGYYSNWCFDLQSSSDELAERLDMANPAEGSWIGPYTRKGGKVGTRQYLNHAAYCEPDSLFLVLTIRREMLVLGFGERRAEAGPQSPIAEWMLLR